SVGCHRFFVARCFYELPSTNLGYRSIFLGCALDPSGYGADRRRWCAQHWGINRRTTDHLGGRWADQRRDSSNCQLLIFTGHLSDLGPVHTGYKCCDAVVNRMDHLVFARPCANRYLLLDHYSGGLDHCHCFHYREPAYSLGDTTKPLKTRNSTGKPLVYGTHGNPVVSIVCTWCIHAA